MPMTELKKLKEHKPKQKKTATLRPDLVIKCYKNVPKQFFTAKYTVNEEMFTRNRKEVAE